tara:strand:+ start:15338 stop:16039 length:702 start_codon:yes stop_codon:yes gene_type:complete
MAQTWLTEKPVSAAVLQSHLPLGRAWAGFRIPAKLAYRLVTALGNVHQDAWKYLASLYARIDYRTSTEMLTEWETAVGLPDKCFPRVSSETERRQWIAFRLDKTRWNTVADWHALAALFGVTVRITPGYLVQRAALFAEYYPRPYYEFPKLGRFRVYVDMLDQTFGGYPYDATVEGYEFEIPYSADSTASNQFRCVLEKVCPANVLIIWNRFPAIPPHGNSYTFDLEFDEEFS